MKILIAFDGSEAANAALDELKLAGLPSRGVEAHILSVAEVWMPLNEKKNSAPSGYPDVIERLTHERRKLAEHVVKEMTEASMSAAQKVATSFPDWDVSDHILTGSPGWEVLAYADKFGPDLIVVGATGKNVATKLLLGSTTRKIITESKYSVRVVRKQERDEVGPVRVLVGFDGSDGSIMAAERVASRNWHSKADVLLTSATHSLVPTAIGRLIPPIRDFVAEEDKAQLEYLQGIANAPMEKIKEAGNSVTFEMVEGNPKDVVVKTAIDWKADSIFIGAHSYSAVERYLIGSTAAAIAERAPCSVEVCR